jgi:K+-transporting ATPase ATPase A chain
MGAIHWSALQATAQEPMADPGPRLFTILTRCARSGTGNNGSAFAGFGAGTPYHNTMIGIAMLLGRYSSSFPCSRSPVRSR